MSAGALVRFTEVPASEFMMYARNNARSQIDFVNKRLGCCRSRLGLFAFSVLSSGSNEQVEIARLRQQIEAMTVERTKLVQG